MLCFSPRSIDYFNLYNREHYFYTQFRRNAGKSRGSGEREPGTPAAPVPDHPGLESGEGEIRRSADGRGVYNVSEISYFEKCIIGASG